MAQAEKPLVIPGFTSKEFQSQVAAVVADLKQGEWAAARAKADLLPQRKLVVEYDDRQVPDDKKVAFRQGFVDAMTKWNEGSKGYFQVVEGKGGQLKVDFVPVLATDEDTGLPRGATGFWNDSNPRLEYVIGLARMNPGQSISQVHVRNETMYAISAVMGLAFTAIPGYPTFRTDTMADMALRVDRLSATIIDRAVSLSDSLRSAAAAHKTVGLKFPKALFGTMFYNGAPMEEGEPYRFEVPVSNTGEADLHVAPVPDCSCFSFDGPDTIAPGTTGVFRVRSDTRGFFGLQRKTIYFYSDDPEDPVKTFRFQAFVKPRLRVLDALDNKPLAVDDSGTKATFFVYSPAGREFHLSDPSISGVAGTAKISPLTEELADKAMNEGPQKRVGYRVDLLLAPDTVSGLAPVSVQVKTDDPKHPVVHYRVVLQRGIVSDLEELYFGTGPRKTIVRMATLSTAGIPFKVTGFESSDPAVSAVAEQIAPDKVRIQVTLHDKVDFGDFLGELRIKTDSPKQPTVYLRLRARVE